MTAVQLVVKVVTIFLVWICLMDAQVVLAVIPVIPAIAVMNTVIEVILTQPLAVVVKINVMLVIIFVMEARQNGMLVVVMEARQDGKYRKNNR